MRVGLAFTAGFAAAWVAASLYVAHKLGILTGKEYA